MRLTYVLTNSNQKIDHLLKLRHDKSAYNKAHPLKEHELILRTISACKEHYLMEAAHHPLLLTALFQKLQNDSRATLLQFIHIK